MYYTGGVVVSSYTTISSASRRENQRARFEAEAGKTYYFKWTAGPMESGIKVTAEDPEKVAKEIRKLHLSKPPDDKEEVKAAVTGPIWAAHASTTRRS
jgi:transposase